MTATLQFVPRGPCAILPRALGLELAANVAAPARVEGDCVVVDIRGPLTSHPTMGMDSYDGILARVQTACTAPVQDIVLRLDSPGGDVANCFETARAIRAACDAAGKRLTTYIAGGGASAAYALACAADAIYASSTSCVGSVGVIDVMVSAVRKNQAMGVDTAMVTSGARKADGNPNVPLTEDAIAAHQAHVDDLAAVFFAWVAERRGMSAEAVAGLNAAVFVGAKAQDAGLVDGIADFGALQEIRKSGTITATARNVPQGNADMTTPKASKFTDAMAALAAMAEEGEGDDKEKAKRAMKKMLADDKPAEEPKKDEAKAESDPPAEEPKKEAVAAQAAAVVPGADLLATVAELKAVIAAMAEAAKAPAAPKATLTPPAVPTPTVGATAGQPTGLDAGESAELKARMGLTPHPTAAVRKFGPDLTIFGATEEQAAKIAAERGF